MAEPVRVRRLTDQEGQRLQQIVRRGSTSSVRYRRAMMLLASAGGNRVPVIAQLVQADEDTVRDVIHRFNEIGLACLDPRWAGGRPRLLSPDDEDFVVQTATTRPGQARPALHPLVAAQTRRLPAQSPRPGDPHRPRGVTRACSPAAASPSSAPRPGRSPRTPSATPSWTASSTSWTASRTGSSRSTSSARSESGPPAGSGWAEQTRPTGCRRPTTAPTASGTSTAATRSATTRCGASTAARRAPGTRWPR